MRALCAALLITFVAGPVFAQDTHIPRYGEEDKDKTQQQKDDEKRAERAYKRSLGNIPDKGPSDPWGSVRSDTPSKPPASAAPKATPKDTAAKGSKAGATAN